MTIDNEFEIAAPVDTVWAMLKDVPRIAPCIPGAEITEVVDENTYRAKVTVKVGPVTVNYKATIKIESMDDATKTATINVQGDDVKGRGGVKATVVSRASVEGDVTRVDLHTDAQVAGVIATVGGRLIEGTAKSMVAQFATNLSKILTDGRDR